MPNEIMPGPPPSESIGLPWTESAPEHPPFPEPPKDLLIDDGEPLESNWHVLQIHLLIDSIKWHRRDRRDYFAGGNMFIYFSSEHARNRDFRGPDFFLVNNVPPNPDRPYWAIWDEGGRYPDLIIELLSETTRKVDLTTKFRVYEETFATSEYVAYDPASRKILAWHKINGVFKPIPADPDGRFPLQTAGLKIGTWKGYLKDYETTWLRFFDDQGRVALIGDEAEHLRAEQEKARADALKTRADELTARADELKARADEEKARADALASELARLKAQIHAEPHE